MLAVATGHQQADHVVSISWRKGGDQQEFRLAARAPVTRMPGTSFSRMMMYSTPSSVVSLPDYLPDRIST